MLEYKRTKSNWDFLAEDLNVAVAEGWSLERIFEYKGSDSLLILFCRPASIEKQIEIGNKILRMQD